jgi:hypothetical protein
MNGLYKKVIKGEFKELPPTFSLDLAKVVKSMLKLDPKERPNCEEILRMPEV